MNYVQKLKFREKPNYDYVRTELIGLMKKNGYELDYKHDWEYLWFNNYPIIIHFKSADL